MSIYKPRARSKPTHKWLAHVVCQDLSIDYVRTISSDKEVARQWAVEESRRIDRRRLGLITAAEELRAAAVKQPIFELLDQFTAVRRATGITAKEVDQVDMRARYMLELMKVESIDDLTQDKATLAMSSLHDSEDLSLKTCNDYLKALKRFCRYLSRTVGCNDQIQWVKPFNAQTDIRHARRAPDDQDINRFLAATIAGKDFVWYGGIVTPQVRELVYLLAMGTGLRYSELRYLKPEHFRLSAGPLFPPVVIVEAGSSKHRQRDEQPLPRDLADRLAKYIADKPRGKPIWTLPDRAYRMIQFDLAAAGLAYETAEGFWDFHALRHVYGTRLGRGTLLPDGSHKPANAKVVQKLMRHSDIRLTMKYLHASMHDQVGALEGLPPLGSQGGQQIERATGTDNVRPDGRRVQRPAQQMSFPEVPAGSLTFPLAPENKASKKLEKGRIFRGNHLFDSQRQLRSTEPKVEGSSPSRCVQQ